MEASIGRPQPIPATLGIFPRLVEKLRLMKASISLITMAVCISVYVVDASGTTSGSDQEPECRLLLGMFSKDTRDFQIETSSNNDSFQIRPLNGTDRWCSSENETHPWIKIDLIVPMKIQAFVLDWDLEEQYNNKTQFHVEYGIDNKNLIIYSEDGIPKIFIQSCDFNNGNSKQLIWFRNQVVARFMKIKFISIIGSKTCVKLALIGCHVPLHKRSIFTGVDMKGNIELKRSHKITKRGLDGLWNYWSLKKYEDEYINDNKGIINSPLFPNNYPGGIVKEITIHAGEQFVKLTLQYVSLAMVSDEEDTDKDILTIDFGKGNTIELTSDNQDMFKHATFISTTGTVSITLVAYVMSKTTEKKYMYQLEYEKVDYPGCGVGKSVHVMCTAQAAFVASRLYPSLFRKAFTNVIKIRGKSGQYIKLQFIDIDLSVHDHVEVFDVDVNSGWKNLYSLWSSKETRALQLVESSWHRIVIKSKTGGKLKGRGFLGRYEIIDVQPFDEDFSTCGCPSGQYIFQQSCYSVENVKGFNSQRNAETRCQSYGGHLVSIGSEQEMKFIFSLCAKKKPKIVYGRSVLIGLMKVTDNSCYQWTDGTPLVYTAWFAGSSKYSPQPDGGHNEMCTALVFTNGHNLHNWHDVPCNSYTEVFVCEMPSANQDLPSIGWNHTEASPNVPIDGDRLFRCDTREIVSKQAVCDSLQNCLDDSDETDCVKDADTCSDLQFRCDDGNCIPWSYYCDHVPQCKNGSDERVCSWPKCMTSEWKCGNSQCIPEYQRCDLVKHCIDGSDEINCGSAIAQYCFTTQCPNKIKIDKQSCEDWWISGARLDGNYSVDIDSVSIKVVCIFKVTSSGVVIITSIDESATSTPYVSSSIVQKQITRGINCSKTLEITCYNKTIDRNDYYYDVIHTVCKFKDCKCLKVIWEGLDVILPLTDSITVYDPTLLLMLENVPTYNVSYYEDGFVYITLSPVVCTTELSLTSTENNTTSTVERCIFNFESKTCTDMSHLQNCDEVVCPFGYFKCPQSFCLSSEFVCDGTSHCPNGHDETYCDTRRCPGLFRCRESKMCLAIEKVCDGIAHCPMVDDEVGCNIACPEACFCNGSVVVCQFIVLPDVFGTLDANVRKLDISYSNFRRKVFSVPDMLFVGEVICHDSNIEELPFSSFDSLINLLFLDLSYNRITLVPNRTFHSLTKLRHLNLAGNSLKILEEFSFVGLKSLQYLNVSSNQIHTVENTAFDGLSSLFPTNLLFLDLSNNKIKIVTNRTFHSLTNLRHLSLAGNLLKILGEFSFVGLKRLQYLNVSSNEIHTLEHNAFDGLSSLIRINLMNNELPIISGEIFSPLKQLKVLSSDLFHLCCPLIKPKTVTNENCYPQQDEFSSCDDLIRNTTLRMSIWIVGILSLVGNIGVIIYRLKRQRREAVNAHGLYVLNLSISDMLMGIYLLLIAVADVYYKGDYVANDISWRQSYYCKLAGVLSTMSSEASVTFILLLTVDCFLKVRFPFQIRYHLTIRRAMLSFTVTWVIVAVLGILPNFYKPYFADYFYSQNSVCLALPFSKKKTKGWEYSVALFVVYNSVVFMIIAFMQIGIYNAGKSSNRVIKTNSKQDFVLARRITLIIVTDFLCWVPIGILGIISLQGHIFPPDVYAWVAVFVLPINSALNPFLYTFSEVLNQNLVKIKETAKDIVYQRSMRNRRKKNRMIDWAIPSSIHRKRRKLSLKMKNLKDVLKRKDLHVKPVEAYTLIFNVVLRVAELHRNGYTVAGNINPETVIVYLDNKSVVQAEIDSTIRKLVYRSDSDRSIADIGLLARTILRRLQQQQK